MKLSLIELRYSEREAGLETYKEYRILEILDNKRNWRKSNKKLMLRMFLDGTGAHL